MPDPAVSVAAPSIRVLPPEEKDSSECNHCERHGSDLRVLYEIKLGDETNRKDRDNVICAQCLIIGPRAED